MTSLKHQEIVNHPERDRLALLIASAHQQQGNHEGARQWGKWALSWGCPPRIAAKIFISSVHNTLGRIAALKQEAKEAQKHFTESINLAEQQNSELMGHTRAVREMTKLGLLPQAVNYIDEEQKALNNHRPTKQQAITSMLRTEVELLSHELSLAQQRHQLFSKGTSLDEPPHSHYKISKLELKKKSVSQLGQDLWVLEQTGFKRNGFFVDFGATDGVLLNNTYLLEKEFSWRGICAEPNPIYFNRLSANRQCTTTKECIAEKTGENVKFIFANEFGGIAEFVKTGKHHDKIIAYEQQGLFTNLKTISLDDFLLKYNAPKEIDYLTIDTEGSEYSILSKFPFNNWKIQCITVEHNFEPQREKIYSLLIDNGYIRTKCQWDDFYFLIS